MNINVRKSTIIPMINIVKNKKKGINIEKDLSLLLDHPDYQIEFQRYQKDGVDRSFTKEEFMNFFCNIDSIKKTDISNMRLRQRYDSLKELFGNTEKYEKRYETVINLTSDYIKDAHNITFNGLPEMYHITDLEVVISIGLGQSGGWFYNGHSHYDLMQFFEDGVDDVLKHTIAHESHHLGFERLFNDIDTSNYSYNDLFLLYLSGEGLAVKYCNNGEGKLTKRIYDNNVNCGVNEVDWSYMMEEFDYSFNRLKTFYNRENLTKESFENEIVNYWFKLEEDKLPKMQSRNYYMGAEIWGLIHDTYGMEKTFEIMRDMTTFRHYFNQALIKIGKQELSL